MDNITISDGRCGMFVIFALHWWCYFIGESVVDPRYANGVVLIGCVQWPCDIMLTRVSQRICILISRVWGPNIVFLLIFCWDWCERIHVH